MSIENIKRTVNSESSLISLKVQVATALRAEFIKKDLKQKEVAERMDMSQARISQILNGHGTLESLLKMAGYLDLEPKITLKERQGV